MRNLGSGRRAVLWGAGTVGLLLLLFLYGTYDPERSNLFPKCPFYALTGLRCPGCGAQRAIHSLIRLDISSAWRYNALLVVMIPVVPVLYLAQAGRNRFPRFYHALFGPRFTIGVLVAVILWWIVRLTCDI
jgi:hypothetical protein